MYSEIYAQRFSYSHNLWRWAGLAHHLHEDLDPYCHNVQVEEIMMIGGPVNKRHSQETGNTRSHRNTLARLTN